MSAVGLVMVGATVLAHGVTTRTSAPFNAAQSLDVRDTASEVFGSFAGTDEQRDAGLVLRAHALNGAMDDCMDAAGFPAWDSSRTRQYATPRDPMGDGIWLAEPMRPFRSAQLIAQRERLAQEKILNAEATSTAEADAALTCAHNAPQTSEDKANALSISPVASKLIEQWSTLISDFVSKSAPPLETYVNCMNSTKIPALDERGYRSEDLGVAMSAVSPGDDEIPSGPNDPLYEAEPWQRLLEAEHQVNLADWECRSDVYDELMNKIEPELQRFATENATEILAAEKQWSEIEVDAGRLGYHGQIGPLGV